MSFVCCNNKNLLFRVGTTGWNVLVLQIHVEAILQIEYCTVESLLYLQVVEIFHSSKIK